MATPYYDSETDGPVYAVQPDYEDNYDHDDSDMETISSASTARTASTITSDEISGQIPLVFSHSTVYELHFLPRLFSRSARPRIPS